MTEQNYVSVEDLQAALDKGEDLAPDDTYDLLYERVEILIRRAKLWRQGAATLRTDPKWDGRELHPSQRPLEESPLGALFRGESTGWRPRQPEEPARPDGWRPEGPA